MEDLPVELHIGDKIFTKQKLRLGDYYCKMGKPAVLMKSCGKTEVISMTDFAEMLYGAEVSSITIRMKNGSMRPTRTSLLT